ncbi:protein mono-ADP-ribosyltransferase PARP4 isoform X3 [Eleutherodactylus coqui]|uniref:protein mono-ADP-ribosyltransferase PARP4 isoform X3 n=1 Tax=Eleutherodactylus coqui TaxID=57060 RepID=UPI0034628811
MGVGIFSDCIFFLKVNSLPLKERTKLKSSITSNGGEISFVLNEKCTHVIACNPATLNNTQQKKIEKYVISVVNPDFIRKSVQEQRLIELECQDNDKPFEVTGDEDEVSPEEKRNQFLEKFLAVKKKDIREGTLEEDVEFEDCEELVNVDDIPDDTEVAKYSCFQKDKEYAIVELLCFNRQKPFPFRISTVQELPNTSQKEFRFHQVDTAGKACEKYEFQLNDIQNKGFTQLNKIPLEAENLASKALQKVLLGEASTTELTPEVAGLVEILWVNAVGHLDSILSCPMENISLNDVSKAEGILAQLRNALIKKDNKKDIHQMVKEFYQFIPHKEKMRGEITMKFLTVKQDLCQVIRDMVNVCETNLSRHNSTSNAKYQALRCRIDHIDPNSAEFHQVKLGILDNNHSNREFNILRVFRVGRLSEATNFMSDLGNVKPLLHASAPCNFVGILSRGLMLPKIIVEEFGGERTDIGNLGSGIYFSDSISTSVKYSQPSDVTGSRILVVCDVALGKCTDVYHRNYTLTEPPHDFNSVHGVQCKDGVNSDFIDDEYVVYNVNQVQMRYIVEFSTDGDTVDLQVESLFISIDQTPDQCKRLPEPSEDVSIGDLPDREVTKAGLKGSDGQKIPLQSIHVKARLMDLVAKVVMFQTYKNNSTFPIEAKYVFPLDNTASVCGFEAFINGKHIIGEVKEKQQAHREYRAAISEGHGAYLMDQDAPDVFTVSVGNLPPKATVVIKITYVMEQQFQYGYTSFTIPGNVAQWQQDNALKENTQDTVTKVGIESDKAAEGPFCLDMSIEMPRKIEQIVCYTHKLKIKRTECKAVIQTEESSSFNENGICVDIYVEDAYIPRMWVENHPDEDSQACMLVFKPSFEDVDYSFRGDVYLTICLDCSNSMESSFHSAKQVALLALQHLSYSYVNFVLFGSNYKELYSYPKPYHHDTSAIEQFIKEAKPTMGSTEFWKVLRSLYLLRPQTGNHKVVLISDGHVQNENLVFQILKKNLFQLFTCGVGTPTNKHMLKCFAQYGSGAFEYFDDNSKSKWRDQMSNHDSRLYSPPCTAVSVKWRQFNQNSSEILQAPRNIQALFNNDWLLVYGFVPHCTQATLKALIANKEFENMVSTTELQKTTGLILHTLTARALIKDYEYGILHEKENENEMKKQEMKSLIIQLSKEYSLVTPFTSFVAVEKRTAEENIDLEPNVAEIISAEDVDILPYMDWSSLNDMRTMPFSCAAIEERISEERSGSSSFVEDERSMESETQDTEYDDVISVKYCKRKKKLKIAEPTAPFSKSVVQNLPLAICKRSLDMCPPPPQLGLIPDHRPVPLPGAGRPLLFGSAPFGSLPPTQIAVTSSKSLFGQSSSDMPPPPPPLGLIPDHRPVPLPGAGQPLLFGSAPFGSLPSGGSSLPSLQIAVMPSNSLFGQSSSDMCPPLPPRLGLIPGPRPMPQPGAGRPLLFGSASFGSLPSGGFSLPQSQIAVTSSSSLFGQSSSAVEPPSALFSSRPPCPPVLQAGSGMSQLGSVPCTTSSYSKGFSLPEINSAVMPSSSLFAQSSSVKGSFGKVRRKESIVDGDFSEEEGRFLEVPAKAAFKSTAQFTSSSSSEGFSFAQKQSGVESLELLKAQPTSYICNLKESSFTQLNSETEHVNISRRRKNRRSTALVSSSSSASGSPVGYMRTSIKVSILLDAEGSLRKRFEIPSWSSLSLLQSEEGYWLLNLELGELLGINVRYLTEDFLVKKGITSLGTRGIDTIHKLIATLLVLQVVRTFNLLREIKFKTLMKLDESVPKCLYPSIEKAIHWALKSDQQYPGICMRLGLGKDWDQATRHLLGLDPMSTTSDLYSQSLFLE